MTMPEPLAAWDARDPQWPRRRQEKSNWLREHGVPVNHAYRTEFYLVDAPFVRVFTYHLNEDGRPHWDEAHNCTRRPATEPPFDMPLSELPPRELLS